MKLNRTPNPLDRNARNGENDNWDIIEGETKKIKDRVDNFLDNVSEDAFNKIIDDIRLNWSHTVSNFSDLPSNPKKGDTVAVESDDMIYRYDGSTWIAVIPFTQFSAIAEIDNRLSSQLADIAINVKTFGAIGDGEHNDAQSIQGAIDYVFNKGGGTVLLPKGTYLFNDDIHVKENVKLKGNGSLLKSDSGGYIYPHFKSTIRDIEFLYSDDYNDHCFIFKNKYVVPLTLENTLPSGFRKTGYTEILIENIKISKRNFSSASSNANAFYLLSEGFNEGVNHSGYWGIEFNNIYINNFNTCITMETENDGWINNNLFENITANQFVNFSKSIMSNGSKGIDYNVFNGCIIQTNPQTRDIFVESTSPKSRNVLQNSTIWDMKTYKSARLGNIEIVKNIIDHVSVPKTKYISQLELGNTYLIGRFNTRENNIAHCLLKVISNNDYHTEFYVGAAGRVEIRTKGRDAHNDSIEFHYRDIGDNQRELYIKPTKTINATVYVESVREFSLSPVTIYSDSEGGVDDLIPITFLRNFKKGGSIVRTLGNDIDIIAGVNTTILWSDQEHKNDLPFEVSSTEIIVPEQVTKIKLSLNLLFGVDFSKDYTKIVRILKNGETFYGGVHLNTYDIIINAVTSVIDVKGGDRFSVEVRHNNTNQNLKLFNSRGTWFSAEFIV